MKHEHAPETQTGTAKPEAATPEKVTSGMAMLDAVLATGHPPIARVVEILRSHQGESAALIARLHQTLGNAYVQDVIKAMKPKSGNAEVERQLANARREVRGAGLSLEGTQATKQKDTAYEVRTYGALPIDSATIARAAIDKAHRRFARAVQALDELDERLHEVLEVEEAFPDEQVAAQIKAWHHLPEYEEAETEYKAACENLRATMAKFEADFDDGVAEGEMSADEAISNHEALAYAGLDGAAAAYTWVSSKASVDPKTHKVAAVTATPFAGKEKELDGLLDVISTAAVREVTHDVHEAAVAGQTPRTRFEMVWEAMRENLERLNQIEGTIALTAFMAKLRATLESVEYFDAATGAATPALARAIEELALEMKDLGPIEIRIVKTVTNTLKMCSFATNVAVGDARAMIAGAKEFHEAAAELGSILDSKPNPESVEEMEKLKSAAEHVERTGKALRVGLYGLGLAADVMGFLDDIEAVKKDNHNPFRYTALIGDLVGAMGDALLLLPPPGDAVGALISLVGHGITAVSQLLAAIWAAFEPPQVTKDRAKIYKERGAGTGNAVDDRTLSSPFADANVHSLAQAGIAQPDILRVVHRFPELMDTSRAVYLLLWTRYTLLTSGVGVPEPDGSGWRRYTLNGKGALDFVWDAAYHFGGSITDLAGLVDQKETSVWSRMIGKHWIGDRDGDGIYGRNEYTVGGVIPVKNG